MSVRYVVVRRCSQPNGPYELHDAGRGVAEAAFAGRAAADADRERREELTRRTVNPWRFGYDATTLGTYDEDDEFALQLLDRGIPVPSETVAHGFAYYNWLAWWDTTDLTDDQRAVVWGLLDKLRFYDVVEVPLED